MKKKLLAAFDDPGGGLVISTVLEELIKDDRIKLEIYCGELSEKFLHTEYNKIQSNISRGKAEEIIDKVRPDLLLTATSGGTAEQELRNVAYEKNIPSVVILDFWKDYSRRWLYASNPIEALKDKICVMDEKTREEMTRENFRKENLFMTGQPYLDKIFNHTNSNKEEIIKADNHFLFLSQPFETIGITDYDIHPAAVLVKALKEVGRLKNELISLTIKLHPAEDLSEELSDLVSMNKTDEFDIKFANDLKTLKELFNINDAVIGYNTIAMFEARASGKRAISLNIAKMNDSLIDAMNTAGIEFVKVDANDIKEKIVQSEKTDTRKNIFGGGIENCVSVVLKELNLQ